ncbi:MAG: NAD(P)/FAD-dependent oxidoreductase [Rhodoferax sp.]|nr:MAG: NAD(P)/FAD-dependent oxidoreductase [Rhodoferax sp.]
MPSPHASPVCVKQHEVIIIGAGFGGIGLAARLLQIGISDLLVLEKSADVGGVWAANRYLGAACDVPSHLYSFSFAPNPHWSRRFAPQAEILRYLQDTARATGVLPHVRLNTEVQGARWLQELALWEVTLASGETVRCRVLVSAVGQLSRPLVPTIAGQDQLGVPQFHSAQWDAGVDLAGKTVAVVGTGASAIQLVPELARMAKRLLVFQRTPAYVIPRPDAEFAPFTRARFARWPWLQRIYRWGIYWQYELRGLGFTRFAFLLEWLGKRQFEGMLRAQVADPQLREALTPRYAIGCKRVLMSNDYFAALAKPHVQLVQQALQRMEPQTLLTADGQRHAVDAVVYGTGFAATSLLAPMRICGVGGTDLHARWQQQGAAAYLGLSVPGFPNFFMLYGPNTNLGHNSILVMLEAQIDHVLRCVYKLRKNGARAMELREPVLQRFHASMRQRFAHTVFAAGCQSWYLDKDGHSPTNWPGFTVSYCLRARYGSLGVYRFA